MSTYTVDFVGLACFSKRDGKGRFVLLPDGRDPGPGIDPHIPRLVVRSDAVEQVDPDLQAETVDGATVIRLPECTLELEGADVADAKDTTLDTTEHDPFVQRLSDVDPLFDADETADTVVRLRIRRGTLQAFRFPGTAENDPDPAVVSRLTVPHEKSVTIRVTPVNSRKTARIRLSAGAEIVLANSAPRTNPLNTRNHFLIYEKLSKNPVDLSQRSPSRGGRLAPLPSNNPFFGFGSRSGANGDCGNTGCCG